MDFINGCTTNVHLLDGFSTTAFTQYTHIAPHSNVYQKIKDAQSKVVELRWSKALCTLVDQDIWVFGDGEHDLGSSYTIAKTGTVEGRKDVTCLLLHAIESALAFTLAQKGHLTHVAPWTWLYCSRSLEDEPDILMVTLRVKDTPNGALYLLSEVTPSTWMPSDQASDHVNEDVLVAPHGKIAVIAAEDATGVTADVQWKESVTDALKLDGIALDEDAEWINVELSEDGTTSIFTWPSELCLLRQSLPLPAQLAWADRTEWQTWTDNGQGRLYRDPLAEAEDWFAGFAERISRAAEEADKEAAHMESNGPSSFAIANDISMTTSPPFMQRTVDHQVAMSGMYPTPPDGLAQQGQTQLGAQSAMSAATPSMVPVGDTAAAPEIINDAQDHGDDALGLGSYSMDEVEEDLFGDVGGEMFEENEVGDADFDYFDEPDDEPAAEASAGEVDTEMTDMPVVDNRSDLCIDDTADGTDAEPVDLHRKSGPVLQPVSSPPSAALSSRLATDPKVDEQASEIKRRPLSPFGIRERLLPPPVPASVAHGSDTSKQLRRSSSFAPIIFRDGVDLAAKYASVDVGPDFVGNVSASEPSIALPPFRTADQSDDDSDESESAASETDDGELPPRLPWEATKKRKRGGHVVDTGSADFGGTWREENTGVYEGNDDNEQQRSLRRALLDQVLCATLPRNEELFVKQASPAIKQSKEEDGELPSLEELYDLEKEDLIYIAQLVSEQSATCLATRPSPSSRHSRSAFTATLLIKALADLLSSPFEICDVSRLALTRDPAPQPRAIPRAPVPPRSGPDIPDIFSLPAPFVRIQRNNDKWEMLPPALSFWEPNGLAAASGPKHVRARAIFPSNSDLKDATRGFMEALGRAYEGCKLGTHSYATYDNGEFDGGALVEEEGEESSKSALLKGYAKACARVGRELAIWFSAFGWQSGWDGTFVVYMLDPFTGEGWAGGKKYMCACFWTLFQAYLDRLKPGNKSRGNSAVPDVVLQVIPIEHVASMDRLIIPDPLMLASLAREVYDRCPAPLSVEGEGDGEASPSILLAPPVPKRIAFQLLADVPAESLLQDGRVLHLAAVMSGDREWMNCVWSDGQGRNVLQESFCLRGLTVGTVVRQAWERTCELIGRMRVVWRVFVALEEGVWSGVGLERVWRDVVTSGRVGDMIVCVTLVKTFVKLGLEVAAELGCGDGVMGLATPASTPIAFPGGNGATTGTSSPNVSASDGFGAPLTPAPSESTISGAVAAMQVLENDPDAHLVEVEDESCGMLFKPQLSALTGMDGMANGAIIRRGRGDASMRALLGVSLYWTLQVKSQGGGAVEIGSLRQAEVTLREVLRMYRALGVLTRARGLYEGEGGVQPVHLAVACKGARGLEGMMS